MAIGFSNISTAQSLYLTPLEIDYSSCIDYKRPSNQFAKNLETTPVDQVGLSHTDLLYFANIFKNGGPETIPNISKTIKIVEYIINNPSAKPFIKARALKIQAQLIYAGHGYKRDTEKAKNILKDIIKNLDPTAKLNLAKMVEVEGQFKQAEELYKQALEQKDPVAALALAYMYHNKDIIVPDETTSTYVLLAQNMLLEKLARGQCDYFGKIGSMYLNLRGLVDNEKYAARWLLHAAKFDHAHNKQQLATLINKGYLSDIKDKPTAEQLWREAALLGSDKAMFDLGTSLLSHGNTKIEAIEWIEKSANRHNMKSIEFLIDYYDPNKGDGSFEKYKFWLDKASQYDDVDPKLLFEYAKTLEQVTDADKKLIFALYERAGREGHDEALYEMGQSYQYGLGVERNPTKALRFYRLATQKANLNAYESLIESYQCGIGKLKNKTTAQKWRERGEYYGLASIYSKIESEFKNAKNKKQQEAIVRDYLPKITMIARDKKSARAMIKLNAMYLFLGEKEKAEFWFNRALSLKNSSDALYHYAQELRQSIFIETNDEKSQLFMKKAADQNNTSALKRLGQSLEKEGQFAKARDLFKKSYELGDESSLIKLASMEHKLKNFEISRSYLEKSANDNNTKAMFELAHAYGSGGWINPSHPEKSSYWFNRALQNNICDTQHILKIIESYTTGKNGAPLNLEKAQKWMKRLESFDNLSDSNKIKYVSFMNQSDVFKTTPEYKAAINAIEKMAEDRHLNALDFIVSYYLDNLDQPEKAFYWINKAASNNNTHAMTQLGKLYLSGHLVKQSKEKAILWFEKSAKKNDPEAIKLLDILKEKSS